MKAFIAEYGKVIIVAIVIMALLGVANFFASSGTDGIKNNLSKLGLTANGGSECTIANPSTTFFADAGADKNDAVYTFTLSDGSTVSTSDAGFSASNLSNNVTGYTVSKAVSTPRFYMYDTSLKASGKTWQTAYVSTGLTTNTVGSGKTNTAAMLERSDRGTAFDYIASMNSSSSGGYSDWFIGTMAEYDLFASKPSAYFWSSVETSSGHAWFWAYTNQAWNTGYKYKFSAYIVFPLRAF